MSFTLDGCKLRTKNDDVRRLIEELILVFKEILSLRRDGVGLTDPVPTTTGGITNGYVFPSYVPSGW